VLERTVRKPIGEGGKKKWDDQFEGKEFIFPKKYSKTLRPIFTQEFDWAAKEENGTITIIFTPRPPESNKIR